MAPGPSVTGARLDDEGSEHPLLPGQLRAFKEPSALEPSRVGDMGGDDVGGMDGEALG